MAQTEWGLPELPLIDWFDSSDVCESPAHEEAVARLHFLVEHRRRLGLVVGAHGTGKSLLLSVFTSELRRRGLPVANINLLGLDVHEFIWAVGAQLGVNPRVNAQRFEIWRAIADRLTEHRYQQISTIVVLDDADQATDDVLTHVVRLLQIDPSPEARMTMILAADEDQFTKLGPRLLDQCELRVELVGWQLDETAEYLQRWLAKAGEETTKFDDAATGLIHQLGDGNPRRVNQLAQLSMLAGKGEQISTVDQETVESVYHELTATPRDT